MNHMGFKTYSPLSKAMKSSEKFLQIGEGVLFAYLFVCFFNKLACRVSGHVFLKLILLKKAWSMLVYCGLVYPGCFSMSSYMLFSLWLICIGKIQHS